MTLNIETCRDGDDGPGHPLAEVAPAVLAPLLTALGRPAAVIDALPDATFRLTAASGDFAAGAGAGCGASAADAFAGAGRLAFDLALQRCIDAGTAIDWDTIAAADAGGGRWRLRLAPLPGPTGAINRIIATAADLADPAPGGAAVEALLRRAEGLARRGRGAAAAGLDAIGHPALLVAAGGWVIDANAAAAAALPAAQPGAALAAVFAGEDGARLAALAAAAGNGAGAGAGAEPVVLAAAGRSFRLRVSRYADPAARAALIVCEPVDSAAARLAAALENLPAIALIADESGRVEAVSRAFGSLCGCAPATLVGADAGDLVFASLDDPALAALWRAVEARQPWRGSLRFSPVDRAAVTVAATVLPLAPAGPRSGCGLLVFATADAAAAETGDATAARRRRALTVAETAAGLAHELRQPLTAILARCRTSLDGLDAGAADPAPLRASLNSIADAAARAAEIIDTLFSLFQGRDLAVDPVNVNDVVRTAADRAGDLLRRHAIALSLTLDDGLPAVAGRAVALGQVVDNLIRNAAEALAGAGANGERRLEVTTRADQEEVHLSVRDTGPGVAAADLERLFTPFYSSKADGLGLGLAIVRGLVDGHGGRVRIADPDDGGPGTAVHVILPVGQGCRLSAARAAADGELAAAAAGGNHCGR